MTLWFKEPFTVTKIEGHADKHLADAMDDYYNEIFPRIEYIVTIHDWSELQDFDPECRKIVQSILHHVRSKQHEILIHLGPASHIGHKIIRAAAETVSRLKRIPIELFSDDHTFESRIRQILEKYGQ